MTSKKATWPKRIWADKLVAKAAQFEAEARTARATARELRDVGVSAHGLEAEDAVSDAAQFEAKARRLEADAKMYRERADEVEATR